MEPELRDESPTGPGPRSAQPAANAARTMVIVSAAAIGAAIGGAGHRERGDERFLELRLVDAPRPPRPRAGRRTRRS